MKKFNYLRVLILLLIALNAMGSILAQQKVQVVTKTITRNFKESNRFFPVINAEKATIMVHGWDKNELMLILKLISKNPNRKIAESDLEVLKYSVKESEHSIVLSNYFKSEEYKNITSNLIASYELWCPVNVNISITNLYGDIQCEGLKGTIAIQSGFCQDKLKDINGKVTIKSSYDNLDLQNIFGSLFRISMDKSDLSLKNTADTCKIDTKYGSLVIEPSTNLKLMTVTANRTNVKLKVDKIESFNYQLKTQSNEIMVPENYKKMVFKTLGNKCFVLKQLKNANEINISTTYCPIEINLK